MGEYAVEAVDALALATALLGLTVRVVTVGFVPKGTSGRNTIQQRADTLNTTGLYSCVRNPLYLGNFLVVLGLAMSLQVWWFTLLTCFCFMLYYERIVLKEEAFLQSKFGEEYLSWASTTPAFLPNPRVWRAPELRFSPRSVLRRGYQRLLRCRGGLHTDRAWRRLGRGGTDRPRVRSFRHARILGHRDDHLRCIEGGEAQNGPPERGGPLAANTTEFRPSLRRTPPPGAAGSFPPAGQSPRRRASRSRRRRRP